ncbi:CARDB domain-containing protein [Nitrosomonas sp. PY1]|uniref:CARDB domain-containing protein n=1 Tax=Nitrosomonas sp. PY1 TaxID=1803906 RepID=UPI001FC84E4D|nr:CARDB domain-containing protein [Nitrosomonas sp. PY1]
MNPFSRAYVQKRGGTVSPPMVITVSPSSGSTVSGTITISATISGGAAVAGVKFNFNGVQIGSEDTTSPYSVSLDTTAYGSGSYAITAVVRDVNNVITVSDPVSITVNNVTTSPDLIVTALNYSAGVFTATVKNQGSASASGTINCDYKVDGTVRASGSIAGPLASGATASVGTAASYTIAEGTHTILAEVDPGNTIAESNNANNTFSRSITISPPASAHKADYGNYIMQSGSIEADWAGIMTRLDNDPGRKWKGVIVRLTWQQLEKAQGQYDGFQVDINGTLRNAGMSRLKQYRDQLWAKQQRKLILFIHIKMFGGVAVPAYLQQPQYADADHTGTTNTSFMGQYKYTSGNTGPGGHVPNMHVTFVRQRWEALMAAYAAEFNNDPAIEAIIISEQSISHPNDLAISGTATCGWGRAGAWFSGMTTALASARASWSNTGICQWINADRCVMSTTQSNGSLTGFVKDISDLGVGLGMPDCCINDAGLLIVAGTGGHTGSIDMIKKLHSNGPVVIQMSGPALWGSIAGVAQTSPIPFPGPAYNRQFMQDWARTEVFANYVAWMHKNSIYQSTENVNGTPYTTQPASDSISGAYLGKNMNTVTDNWIKHASSDISTYTTKPIGW